MFQLKATQEQVDSLCNTLTKDGISVIKNGTSYEIKGNGIVVNASFDSELLSVTVVKKPFLLTEGFIEGQLKKALGNG